MTLYELGDDKMTAIEQTTFAKLDIKELVVQRLLREQIDIIVPDGLVLAEEFSNWDDSKRRIDLLVLDRNADLVVVELKRTQDGGHMELQAIRYAAMISEMTFQEAVDAHKKFLDKLSIKEDAKVRILAHLNWDEPKEDSFGQVVRIVLASAEFSTELTTAVLWMNKRDLDICCVKMVPHLHDGKTLLDVQQVIPLPEAAEYQVRVKQKALKGQAARKEQGISEERNLRFWAELLLKANAVLDLHKNISPSRDTWVSASAGGMLFNYAVAKGAGRAGFAIQRPNQAENKAIYDDVVQHKAAIEKAFGGPLRWRRMDNSVVSRIVADIEGGSVEDESSWDGLQLAMVDGMRRLESALREYVKKYRDGGSPDGG